MAIILEIHTLERPSWLTGAGMSKGVDHDKQSANLILMPGTELRARLIPPTNDLTVRLDLLNDDQFKESALTLSQEWQSVTVTVPTAVLIRTPYRPYGTSEFKVQVELEAEGNTLSMPTYIDGVSDGDVFLKNWDDTGAPFALVEEAYAHILIPARDKERIRQIHTSTGLNALGIFHTAIFEYFNDMAGLSFNPDQPTDQNIANHYFMKADVNGAGAAYYGAHWTAESSSSVASFWLTLNATSWGTMHEIGHGYQGNFRSVVSVSEVWNNIYAHFFQKKELGDKVYTSGWLYNGNPDSLYARIKSALADHKPLAAWDLRDRLFFFTTVVESIGIAGFTQLNKKWRQLRSDPAGTADIELLGLFVDAAQRHAHVDLGYFMQICNVQPDKMPNSITGPYGGASPVAPAYQLVSENNLPALIENLQLEGPLALVSSAQIRSQDSVAKTAPLTIKMDSDGLSHNFNKILLFRDGSNVTHPVRILLRNQTISDFPVGVYSLIHPDLSTSYRTSSSCYATVMEQSDNELVLNYSPLHLSPLTSQTIALKGLSDKIFCTITVDNFTQRLRINITDTQPHYGFSGQIYASVTVTDEHDRVVFSQEMPGGSTVLNTQSFSTQNPFTITIFHKESGHRVSISPAEHIVANGAVTHVFRTTNQGLVNTQLNNDPSITLRQQMDLAAAELKSPPHLLLHPHLPTRDAITQAMYTFSTADQAVLRERYKDLYPTTIRQDPRTFEGMHYRWRLLGLSDREIAVIQIDLKARTVIVVVNATEPHPRYSDVYVAIWIRDERASPVFMQELRGDTQAIATTFAHSFRLSSQISIMHLEHGHRSALTNVESGASLPTKRIDTLSFEEAGKVVLF